MSAAKMMADSTQGDLDEPRKKRKKKKESEKRKSKKMKKEKESKRSKKVQKEDEDSDLDLEKDLHSIGDYIRERQEMNEQLFHCLRGPTLQRYVPDVLKELSLEELKRRCLEHLEIMSKKRIRRILSGDDPSTISSSGTEEASSSEEEMSQEEQACLDEGTAEIEGEEKSEDDEASMDERGEKSDDEACPDEDEEMPDDDDKSEEDDSREDKSSVIAETSSEEGEISEDSDGGDTVSDTDVKPGPEKSDSEMEEGAVTSDEETQEDGGGDKVVHSAVDEGRKLDNFVATGHKGGDEKSENDGDDGFKGSVMADNNAENLIHGKIDQDSNNREGTSTETDYLIEGKGGSSEVHKMDVEEGEESGTNVVCCETRSRLSEENDKVKAEHVQECQGQLESSEKGHNAPNKFDEDESQDPGEQQNLKINNEHNFTIVENDRATDIIMEDIRSSETKRNEVGSEQEVQIQNKGESQQSTQDEEAIDEGEISVLEDSEKQLSVITSDHAKKDDDVISLGDEDVSVLDLPPLETSAPLASSGLDKSVPIIVDHDTSTEDGKCDKLKSSEISEKESDSEAKNSDKRKVEFVGQREVTLSAQCNVVVKLDKTVSEASSTRKVSLQERLGNKITSSALSKTGTRLVIKTSPDSSGKSRKVSVDASSNVTTVSSTSKIVEKKSRSIKPSKETGISVATKPSSSKLCHTGTIAKGQMVKLQHGKTVESKTISLKTLGGIKTASSSKPTTSSSSSLKPSSSSSKQSTNSSKPSTSASKPSKSSSKQSTSLVKPSTSSSIKSTKTLKTSAASSQVIESGPDDQAGLSKNQMELLELEMRARAIKSMLAAHEKTELHK